LEVSSTVIKIIAKNMRGLASKCLSIFENPEEIKDYLVTYKEYNRLLEEEVGIHLPPHGHAAFIGDDGRPIFISSRGKLPPIQSEVQRSICCRKSRS
jgi:hypothetical protein